MRQPAIYAVKQAQALLGDPRGQFATQEKLLPLIQHGQDTMILNVFRNESASGISAIVVVPDVPLNTTSLGPWMEATRELSGLISIMSMKERMAGDGDDQWDMMSPVTGDLPSVRTNAQMLNCVYLWLGYDLRIPGSVQNEDFRFFGKFAPPQINAPGVMLIPGTEGILSVYAAAFLSISRNKEAYEIFMSQATALEDELFNSLCREKQESDIHQVSNVGYPDEPFYV